MEKESKRTVEQVTGDITKTYQAMEDLSDRRVTLSREREDMVNQLEDHLVRLRQLPLTGMTGGDLAQFDSLLERTLHFSNDLKDFYEGESAKLRTDESRLEKRLDALFLERTHLYQLEEDDANNTKEEA